MADDQTEDTSKKPTPRSLKHRVWNLLRKLFEGLHWLTERFIGLLRLTATVAMFTMVAFIFYNAYASRNTVVVKPFDVPIAMEQGNHAHSGRIIANILKDHLLQAENTFQDEINRGRGNGGVIISQPVTSNEQILIEGESIKLPETGISVDNVIEFISGLFGRKNLNGAVYLEADAIQPNLNKLYLQITLKGRIINFNEDDIGLERRKQLPPTSRDGLNLQLISAMLEAKSKEILSIASEDHNLYYFCTRNTDKIEYKAGKHSEFFDYCSQLQDGNITPQKLQELRNKLSGHPDALYTRSVIGPVLAFLRDESGKKLAQLCQSQRSIASAACQDVSQLAKSMQYSPSRAPYIDPIVSASASILPEPKVSDLLVDPGVLAPAPVLAPDPVATPVDEGNEQAKKELGVAEKLEKYCFPENKESYQMVVLASTLDSRQANQLESDATQLFNNGLYQDSLVKFQEAITHNCMNSVAWANMGILLSTASLESNVRNTDQAQVALKRAIKLNGRLGWIHHSLCVAEAYADDKDLERYLANASCREARLIEPISEALYDKLFYIEIANRYQETEQADKAMEAYITAMSTENRRGCHMQRAVEGLFELGETGNTGAKAAACKIIKAVPPSPEKVAISECEQAISDLATESCS